MIKSYNKERSPKSWSARPALILQGFRTGSCRHWRHRDNGREVGVNCVHKSSSCKSVAINISVRDPKYLVAVDAAPRAVQRRCTFPYGEAGAGIESAQLRGKLRNFPEMQVVNPLDFIDRMEGTL